MDHENAAHDHNDETHIWIACPGCGYDGTIGVPLNYPADVVVCPKCRQVVRVRPEDRVLWRPADAMEFLRRRFPGVDWDADEAAEGVGADARRAPQSPPTSTFRPDDGAAKDDRLDWPCPT